MRRREFILGSGTLLTTPCSAATSYRSDSLGIKARAKGLLYGCAVSSGQLASDRGLFEAVTREADILVHEYEMKRGTLQPSPTSFDFGKPEKVMGFAERTGKLVRGHTLVWYRGNPPWLEEALGAKGASREKLLEGYIRTVARHFDGRLQSWDVVNEAVEPKEGRDDGMRADNPWFRAFGEDYISVAFSTAREAAPSTPLFLNDYGIESDSRSNEARRTAVLKLLDRLRKKNVPIDGFGIQGHLQPYIQDFKASRYESFLRSLEGYGLKLMITEFDVSDRKGPTDPQIRDADVAAVAKDFLDISLASKNMLGVLTWGLSDRYSWLSLDPVQKRSDGELSRVLPLDGAMHRKPMWYAIASALDAAPQRNG